jgi:hypothetical protein
MTDEPWCTECGEWPCICGAIADLVSEMESVYVIEVHVRADRSVRAPGEETG